MKFGFIVGALLMGSMNALAQQSGGPAPLPLVNIYCSVTTDVDLSGKVQTGPAFEVKDLLKPIHVEDAGKAGVKTAIYVNLNSDGSLSLLRVNLNYTLGKSRILAGARSDGKSVALYSGKTIAACAKVPASTGIVN